MTVIGIDLGTTNSLAVAYSDGQVRMIPNSFGEYLTPSVVYYDGAEIQVGKIAREKLVTHPQDTAQLFKLHMPNYSVQTGLPAGRIVSLCPQAVGGRRRGLSRSDGNRAGH